MPTTHFRRIPIREQYFNPQAILPYGLLRGEIKASLEDTHPRKTPALWKSTYLFR